MHQYVSVRNHLRAKTDRQRILVVIIILIGIAFDALIFRQLN